MDNLIEFSPNSIKNKDKETIDDCFLKSQHIDDDFKIIDDDDSKENSQVKSSVHKDKSEVITSYLTQDFLNEWNLIDDNGGDKNEENSKIKIENNYYEIEKLNDNFSYDKIVIEDDDRVEYISQVATIVNTEKSPEEKLNKIRKLEEINSTKKLKQNKIEDDDDKKGQNFDILIEKSQTENYFQQYDIEEVHDNFLSNTTLTNDGKVECTSLITLVENLEKSSEKCWEETNIGKIEKKQKPKKGGYEEHLEELIKIKKNQLAIWKHEQYIKVGSLKNDNAIPLKVFFVQTVIDSLVLKCQLMDGEITNSDFYLAWVPHFARKNVEILLKNIPQRLYLHQPFVKMKKKIIINGRLYSIILNAQRFT